MSSLVSGWNSISPRAIIFFLPWLFNLHILVGRSTSLGVLQSFQSSWMWPLGVKMPQRPKEYDLFNQCTQAQRQSSESCNLSWVTYFPIETRHQRRWWYSRWGRTRIAKTTRFLLSCMKWGFSSCCWKQTKFLSTQISCCKLLWNLPSFMSL